MKINSDLPIQNNSMINSRTENGHAQSETRATSSKDVVEVGTAGDARMRLRETDRNIRDAQDAMTFFRLTDDALGKMEGAAARMQVLAEQASAEDLSDEARENIQFEMDNLADLIDFTASNARMGGVSIFGEGDDTKALWNDMAQKVSGLLSGGDSDAILPISTTAPGSLGLNGLNLATPDGAKDAAAKIDSALSDLASSREMMSAEAESMGNVARDLASRAFNRTASATRFADFNAAASVMDFGAAVAAHAGLTREDVLSLID